MPSSDPAMDRWSAGPLTRLAARKPSGMPRPMAKIMAASDSSTVAGNRRRISVLTDRWVAIDWPKSNVTVRRM